MRVTIHGTVVAFRDDMYKTIVVESLEEPQNSFFKYTMMTICPN